MKDSKIFEQQKYLFAPGLLEPEARAFYYTVAVRRARTGAMAPGDFQVPGTPAIHGDVVMEKLLEELRPAVERLSGLALHPTYSYLRVYKKGDVLERHVDREACEVSVSLCLGQEPGTPWPLWIEGPSGTSKVEMAPGDAVLYRGIECPHWREAYPGEHVAQVFLHYVDAEGPHAALKYDGRPGLWVHRPA
jgi:hypothetical protein